ncbi:MAG: hypothetical protein KDB05_30795, partial [Planctomycetales bacterium]|nr:hypothetical protein [Planctomycetales bacterium]
ITPLDALLIINALNAHSSGKLTTVLPANSQYMPSAKVYLDVNGDGWLAPLDVINVINYLNDIGNAEGEGGTSTFAFVAPDSASPTSQSLHAAKAIALAVVVTAEDIAPTPVAAVQEAIAVKSTAFQRVSNWLTGATDRVASLLDQPAKLHRRLPDTIDLPKTASEFIAADIDEAITDIALDQHVSKDDAESNDLEEAIDDIFGDWDA